MKVLVSGGAGFIGSEFTRSLVSGLYGEIPKKVYVLDLLTYAGNMDNLNGYHERFEFIHGDIADSKLVKDLFSEVDFVINFAAETHVDNSIDSPMPFVHSNFVGTANLLTQLIGFPNIRFIQISTDEVYGSIDFGSWDESFPLNPHSPYSATKAAADLLVQSFVTTYGVNASITRCCNNYGPFQFPEKLIPLFIQKLSRNEKVPVYGDGLNIREWIHVRDHCRAIWQVMNLGEPGEIYNIGSGYELSNLDLTYKLLNHFNKGVESIDFVSDRLGHDRRYSLDSTKIQDKIGFSNKTEFDVGLVETISWYQSQDKFRI